MKHIKKLLALALVAITALAITVPALAETTGFYNTSAVFLRPAVDSKSYLGRVNKNTTCVILDSSTGKGNRLWYKVRITSNTSNDNVNLINKVGWSWADFITISGGTAPSHTPQSMVEAFGSASLKRGSRGNYVKNLQYALYNEGFLDHYTEVDGIFGEKTFSAVWAFQLENWPLLGDTVDEAVDGVVGTRTKNLLWQRQKNLLMSYGYK